MTPIKYHEAAEDELLTEIGYLELRAKGLGRRFYAEIRRVEGDRVCATLMDGYSWAVG